MAVDLCERKVKVVEFLILAISLYASFFQKGDEGTLADAINILIASFLHLLAYSVKIYVLCLELEKIVDSHGAIVTLGFGTFLDFFSLLTYRTDVVIEFMPYFPQLSKAMYDLAICAKDGKFKRTSWDPYVPALFVTYLGLSKCFKPAEVLVLDRITQHLDLAWHEKKFKVVTIRAPIDPPLVADRGGDNGVIDIVVDVPRRNETEATGEMQGNVSTVEEMVRFEELNAKTLKDLEDLYKNHSNKQEELQSAVKCFKDQLDEFEDKDGLELLQKKINEVLERLKEDSSKVFDIEKQCEESTQLILKLEDDRRKLQDQLLQEQKILEELEDNSKVEIENFLTGLTRVLTELEYGDKESSGKLEVSSTESELVTEKGCLEEQNEVTSLQVAARQKFMELLDQKPGTMSSGGGTPGGAAANVSGEDIVNAGKELNEIDEELIPLRHRISDEVQKYQSIDESIPHLKRELAQSQEKIDSLRSQVDYLEKELNSLEAASRPSNNELDKLQKLGKIIVEEKDEISKLTQGSKELMEKVSEVEKEIENAGGEKLKVEKSKVGNTRKHETGRAAYEDARKQLLTLKRKLVNETSSRETIQKEIDDRKAQASYAQKVLKECLKEQESLISLEVAARQKFMEILDQKSGTMSCGGGTPGGAATSVSRETISNVSGEAIAKAGKQLDEIIEKLNSLSQSISDKFQKYQSVETSTSNIKMELAKSQKEIDSLNSQVDYLEKRLDSLEAGSRPSKDEPKRLEKLGEIIVKQEDEIRKLTQGSKELKEKVSELIKKMENGSGENLKVQNLKVGNTRKEIDERSSDVDFHKVQIETGQKMIQKLTKGIENSEKEKESLVLSFEEIKQKAFAVLEKYKETQKLIDQHRDVLDKAKTDYESLKKTMDEWRATEVDTDNNLQDMKRMFKELEANWKGYSKKLEDLHVAISKQIQALHETSHNS